MFDLIDLFSLFLLPVASLVVTVMVWEMVFSSKSILRLK